MKLCSPPAKEEWQDVPGSIQPLPSLPALGEFCVLSPVPRSHLQQQRGEQEVTFTNVGERKKNLKILNYSPKGRFRAAARPKARLKRFIKEVGRQMCPNHRVTIWSLTLKQGPDHLGMKGGGGKASNLPFSSRQGAAERKMLSRNVG